MCQEDSTSSCCRFISYRGVQTAIDEANPGDVIVLKEGTYHWENKKIGKDASLTISKPIRIWGPQLKQKEVILPCNLEIDDKLSIEGSVTVANLILMGPIKVQSNAYDAITFSSVKAEQTNQTGDGTMVHIMRNGKCLFFNCELVGGDEALYIDGIDDLSHSKESNENRVHIKSTLIRNGDKRGICADDKFILEKSIIRDNGWYGIRSNLGWTDKGGNDWQRNPSKPNQTPTSGNGMFDGLSYPVSFNSSGGMSLGTGMTGDMMFPGFGQSANRR